MSQSRSGVQPWLLRRSGGAGRGGPGPGDDRPRAGGPARGEARTLLIYLGGYHNRARRELIRRLWQSPPAAAFLHWGDIDLGGFRICQLLRERSGVPLEPYRMDVETYLAYAHTGVEFGPDYRQKRADLLQAPAYELFHPVIKEMLRLGRRVEQEAVQA